LTLVGWIRIRVRNADPDPDPGGQELPAKKEKKSEKQFIVFKCKNFMEAQG
jgi:hypothetical protein